MTDAGGVTSYTYKPWGKISKETLPVNIPGKSISGIYTAGDFTAEVERTFDAANRIDLLIAKWGTGASFIVPDVDYGFPPWD